MPNYAKFAAFLACFIGSACSLFVSLDGLSDGSAADGGPLQDVSTGVPDSGILDAAASDAAADGNFFDDFNRPDNSLLGNDWIEKNPTAFSLSGDDVLRGDADTLNYSDDMVYRPPSEDVEDSTISIEVTFTKDVVGFPQIHSRIQQNSIGLPGAADSYLFYVNVGSPTVVTLARTRGTGDLSDLTSVSLTQDLSAGERYRLTLKVNGKNPVSLFGTVEHFVSSSWVVIGQGSTVDTDPSQIDDAGSTGFSASDDDTEHYLYDNFTRTSP